MNKCKIFCELPSKNAQAPWLVTELSPWLAHTKTATRFFIAKAQTNVYTNRMKEPKSIHADRVRMVRGELRLTMEQFAKLIGVTTNTISRIENGRHVASMKTLAKMSEKTKIPISYLAAKK